MLKPDRSRRSTSYGFSLIELMVVVAIAGALLAIAIPSYKNSIRKSRRTEAKTALVDLAGREERYYNTNGNAYIATAASLGYGSFAPVGNGYFNVTVTVPAPGIAAPSYLITAVPVPGSDQVKDAACLYYAIDSTGKQTAGASSGAAVTGSPCWL